MLLLQYLNRPGKPAAISGSIKWPGDIVVLELVCKRLLLWRQIFPSCKVITGENAIFAYSSNDKPRSI